MALVLNDNFDGVDGEQLYTRTGWSEAGDILQRATFEILSNDLLCTSTGDFTYSCYADAQQNDHWAGVNFGNDPDGLADSWYGCFNFSKNAQYPDFIRIRRHTSNTKLNVAIFVDEALDSIITLDSTTSDPGGFPINDGDYIEYRRVGDDIDLYKNGNEDGTGGIHLNATTPISVTAAGLAASSYAGFCSLSNTKFQNFKIGNFLPDNPVGWVLEAPNNLLDQDGNPIVGPITVDKAVFRSTYDSSDAPIIVVEDTDPSPVIIDSGGTISYENIALAPAGTTFDVELVWGDNYALIPGQTSVENP